MRCWASQSKPEIHFDHDTQDIYISEDTLSGFLVNRLAD